MNDPWQDYMEHLTDKGLSPAHAEAIRFWWTVATGFLPGLSTPTSAGPYGEFGFCMDWDNPTLHVDVKIEENGSWEWFYSFRDHEEYGGTGDDLEKPLAEGTEEPVVIRYLRIVTLNFFTGTQLELPLEDL